MGRRGSSGANTPSLTRRKRSASASKRTSKVGSVAGTSNKNVNTELQTHIEEEKKRVAGRQTKKSSLNQISGVEKWLSQRRSLGSGDNTSNNANEKRNEGSSQLQPRRKGTGLPDTPTMSMMALRRTRSGTTVASSVQNKGDNGTMPSGVKTHSVRTFTSTLPLNERLSPLKKSRPRRLSRLSSVKVFKDLGPALTDDMSPRSSISANAAELRKSIELRRSGSPSKDRAKRKARAKNKKRNGSKETSRTRGAKFADKGRPRSSTTPTPTSPKLRFQRPKETPTPVNKIQRTKTTAENRHNIGIDDKSNSGIVIIPDKDDVHDIAQKRDGNIVTEHGYRGDATGYIFRDENDGVNERKIKVRSGFASSLSGSGMHVMKDSNITQASTASLAVPTRKRNNAVQRTSILGDLSADAQMSSYVARFVLDRYRKKMRRPREDGEVTTFKDTAVMIADVSGFTRMNESFAELGESGAEKVTTHLNIYFSKLLAIIDKHGGDCVKFAGDALIVIFTINGKRKKREKKELHGKKRGNDSEHSDESFDDEENDSDSIGEESKPSSYKDANNELKTFSEAEEALIRATQAAIELAQLEPYVVGKVTLTLHTAVGFSDVYAMHLGGVDEQWEFLVAGHAFRQLSTAVDLSKRGDVVVSKEAWALLQPHCRGMPAEEFEDDDGERKQTCDDIKVLDVIHPVPVRGNPRITLSPMLALMIKAYVPIPVLDKLQQGIGDKWLAELRRATAVFINLTGLALNSSHCDNPGVVRRANNALRSMQLVVQHNQGYLRQFCVDDKGTVLIVVFGVPPYTWENNPYRAVKTAMEIRDVLRRCYIPHGIGVATGDVYVGSVGSSMRHEHAVVGDTVNTAARLSNKVGAYDIWIDERTYDGAKKRVNCVHVQHLKVKGKNKIIQVFKPVGFKRTIGFDEVSQLLGRQEEVKMFMEAVLTLKMWLSTTYGIMNAKEQDDHSDQRHNLPLRAHSDDSKPKLISTSNHNPLNSPTSIFTGHKSTADKQSPTRPPITKQNSPTSSMFSFLQKAKSFPRSIIMSRKTKKDKQEKKNKAAVANSAEQKAGKTKTKATFQKGFWITGKAGVGKSSLVSKFFQLATIHFNAFYVIGDAAAQNEPYYAIKSMLYEVLDTDETHDRRHREHLVRECFANSPKREHRQLVESLHLLNRLLGLNFPKGLVENKKKLDYFFGADTPENDPQTKSGAKLQRFFGEDVPDPPPRNTSESNSLLGSLNSKRTGGKRLSLELDDLQGDAQLLEKIITVIVTTRCGKGCVWILEDVQWYDHLSWNLLNKIRKKLVEGSIVVITSRDVADQDTNSEYAGTPRVSKTKANRKKKGIKDRSSLNTVGTSSWIPQLSLLYDYENFKAEKNNIHIELRGLKERKYVKELLCQRLRCVSIQDTIVDFVHGYSRGSPFLCVEVIRTLDAKNFIKFDKSKSTGTGRRGECMLNKGCDLADLKIPTSVRGLLTMRLDHLPATELLLAKLASVFGVQFEREALFHVFRVEGGGSNRFGSALMSLEKKGIFTETRSTYYRRFTSPMLQEACVRTMSLELRASIHLNVATYYEGKQIRQEEEEEEDEPGRNSIARISVVKSEDTLGHTQRDATDVRSPAQQVGWHCEKAVMYSDACPIAAAENALQYIGEQWSACKLDSQAIQDRCLSDACSIVQRYPAAIAQAMESSDPDARSFFFILESRLRESNQLQHLDTSEPETTLADPSARDISTNRIDRSRSPTSLSERRGIISLYSPSVTPLKHSPMSQDGNEQTDTDDNNQNTKENDSLESEKEIEKLRLLMLRACEQEQRMTPKELENVNDEMLQPSFVLNWERGQVTWEHGKVELSHRYTRSRVRDAELRPASQIHIPPRSYFVVSETVDNIF